ncbi:hypothetical protein CWB99_08775 [Pseudoalteromonas rubra]|uniref:Integrase catalytic domain-containing protein n=1 Tax=Pseudoalteromonas rubra TaxID=43658 RepID=A0A5S3WNU6_9GAMM|nr:hypothetical protein CWB99_08775 [Pseudoalteromonas rubra]TMP35277.1 hypothetical protein CWC00_05740 [Pseudoalteromonas rubra]
MTDMQLKCKQLGSHSYKKATFERLNILNRLIREFDVRSQNQAWCGDITYIWTGRKWVYLAIVLELCTRRVVGWVFLLKQRLT